MKRFVFAHLLLRSALLFLLVACTREHEAVTWAPVGPQTGHASSSSGTLIVHTSVQPHEYDGVTYLPHKSYEILASNGQHLRYVRNHVGDHDEQPAAIQLPAGHYSVLGEFDRSGVVKVPVSIGPARLTLVEYP